MNGFIAAAGLLALVEHVHAHGIAGNRLFPGTMAFDDPASVQVRYRMYIGSEYSSRVFCLLT